MIDEGYVKYNCTWSPDRPLVSSEIAELNYWRNRLYRQGHQAAAAEARGHEHQGPAPKVAEGDKVAGGDFADGHVGDGVRARVRTAKGVWVAAVGEACGDVVQCLAVAVDVPYQQEGLQDRRCRPRVSGPEGRHVGYGYARIFTLLKSF